MCELLHNMQEKIDRLHAVQHLQIACANDEIKTKADARSMDLMCTTLGREW
jgi:hypothetical protein